MLAFLHSAKYPQLSSGSHSMQRGALCTGHRHLMCTAVWREGIT